MRFGYEVFHPDVDVLVDFYVRVLGFAAPDEDDADDDVAVTRDGLQVGCCRARTATVSPRRPPSGSEIVLRVDDAYSELARVTAAGWPIEDDLQERPWGLIDFRIFDPSGQYIRITSSR